MEINIKPFHKVLEDSTRKFHKVPKSHYLESGIFPIIDQSKDFIAGYTNDETLINKDNLPVIIFGDHTRVLKFVDFPVALGADGAKALTIKSNDFYSKYLYYALKNFDLPDAGYSRHFKFLKEGKFPIPKKIADQKRIAQVLSDCETLIAQRKESIALLDELVRSIFLELFGDPVRNEKGWETEGMNKVVTNIISGTSYGGEAKSELSLNELGVLKISAVTKGVLNPQEFKAVKKASIKKKLIYLEKNMFLMGRANTIELVAACCIVPKDFPKLFLPDKLWSLEINEKKALKPFLNYLFKNENYRSTIRKNASGGHDSMLNISMKKFRSLRLITPPIELQNQFTQIDQKVEQTKKLYQNHLTELENLYGRLSQDAFNGKLDLSGVVLREINIQQMRISLWPRSLRVFIKKGKSQKKLS